MNVILFTDKSYLRIVRAMVARVPRGIVEPVSQPMIRDCVVVINHLCYDCQATLRPIELRRQPLSSQHAVTKPK